MSRMAVVSSMVVISVCVLAVVGHAQLVRLVGPEREMFVYDGDLETDSGGITVTRWGSGEAESVYETTYIGPQVLKVKSQGPYQGIVLHLSRSGDLGDFLASDAGYVDLRLQPAQTRREIEERQQAREERRAGAGGGRAARGGGAARGGRGGAGMRGGGGGAGMRGGRGGGGMRGGGGGPGMRGGRGGGGMRGGGGGAGMRGGARRAGGGAAGAAAQQRARPGASESGEAPSAKVFVLKNVRVVLFTDQGMTIADSVPVDVMPKDKHGWTRVSIPLSQFKGIEGATSLRAVGVFADQSDVFYLGRLGLLIDRTPVEIVVTAEPLVARADQLIDFSVELRGGPINPEIFWDFDEADGIQQEAVGAKVKYLYKEPGDYLATCTVRDRGGVKPEASKSIGIRVEAAA